MLMYVQIYMRVQVDVVLCLWRPEVIPGILLRNVPNIL